MEKIRIPKMNAVITCRNKREESAARIFIMDLRDYARYAAESDDPTYWARKVVDICGSSTRAVEELHGMASVFYYMDMLSEPMSSIEIHEIIVALYKDLKAAGNAPAPAEDEEVEEELRELDEIKADAAYCLGIEYGSDEWYALAEI